MSVKDKAVAIDRFVRTIKESGVYDDIQAACIMAGWTNLAGALYPLKGSAPTNNGFLDADLDAGIGLKGDLSGKWIDSNRNNNADPQDNQHMAVFSSSPPESGVPGTSYRYPFYIGTGGGTTGAAGILRQQSGSTSIYVRCRNAIGFSFPGAALNAGLFATSRASGTSFDFRVGGETTNTLQASQTPYNGDLGIYLSPADTSQTRCNATLSWYSIGSATDLAALDSAVSTLMADLRAIDEAGFDRDAVRYIRNVEAADGAYLETGVKQAINAFVVGCKKDGIWDAIKASCIMCGARTISGALVPLVGTAPTPYNFVAADYDRSGGGLKGDGSTKYLDSNRANDADGQDDRHVAVYRSVNTSGVGRSCWGAGINSTGDSAHFTSSGGGEYATLCWNGSYTILPGASNELGIIAAARSQPGYIDLRFGSKELHASSVSAAPTSQNLLVFARGTAASPSSVTGDRLAFYSIGSSLSLSALDARVTTLVSEIAAAI